MYHSLDFLEENYEAIPVDLVQLLLAATKNIAYFNGLIIKFPYCGLLQKIRYLINYKYSRFHFDQKRKAERLILDHYTELDFIYNLHHLMFEYGIEHLNKIVESNEKLPLFELIKFNKYIDTQSVTALDMTDTKDAALKYQVETIWEMLAEVYSNNDYPPMLNLVNFWTSQHFYDYSFEIEPLCIETFEFLLNQELLGTINLQPNSIYINKSVIISNLRYISGPNSYQRELLKILRDSFSDTEEIIKDIESYVIETTNMVRNEFGDSREAAIMRLLSTEIRINNSDAEKIMKVSLKTAIGYLKRLEKLNLLKFVKSDKQVYYLNTRIMRIIDKY